jgi:predicted esterase
MEAAEAGFLFIKKPVAFALSFYNNSEDAIASELAVIRSQRGRVQPHPPCPVAGRDDCAGDFSPFDRLGASSRSPHAQEDTVFPGRPRVKYVVTMIRHVSRSNIVKSSAVFGFLVSILLANPMGGQTATKFNFEFAGKSRTYYVFIPDNSSPLPVVLLLHGSGRNGQVMVDAWSKLASREAFIVVAPDSSDSSGWSMKSDSPGFFHAVIEQVKARHAIDANRIYLFGHSAGAVHALVLAIIDSHYYAAAVHAGALPTGYEKLLFSMAERRMPIAIWVGADDPLFSVDAVKATTRLFEENSFHVELSVIPNHDHNYYAISDEVNSNAWDFLKKTQLKQPDPPDRH